MSQFEAAFAQLDQFIRQKMGATNTPGLSISLTDREKTLHIACYGDANLAAGLPVTPETLFEIGSIGKSFTNIALLQLYEAGKIDLHAPVSQYLPWFEVQSKYRPITLHDLMTHTSGIINGSDFTGEPRYEAYALRETETGSAPGEYFHYSNVGYKTLGVLLEDVLEQNYADIIRERVLKPLGMNATAPVIDNDMRERLAVGYVAYFDDRPKPPHLPVAPATWFESNTGDGCISSTPGDMAIYLRMLMNRGQEGVLSKSNFDLMSQKLTTSWAEENFYGYGLMTSTVDGHIHLGHSGGMVGYVSNMIADMDSGFGATVLINGPNLNPNEITAHALKVLRAVSEGQELPPLPSEADTQQIANAADYAGIYTSGDKSLTFAAENGQLILKHDGQNLALYLRGEHQFYAYHPDFDRSLLQFGREGEQVVEVFYGGDWYTHERYAGAKSFDYPAEWNAYIGHYRSYNPWISNFRVVLRKGELVAVFPAYSLTEKLVLLENGAFRVGEDARSAERLRFDSMVNGKAVRAKFGAADYYRTFTR